MTAGTQRISSFSLRSIFHALHPSFSPPYVPRRIYYRLSAALLYLWRSRGLIWTVKATAVRANLPTCKGLIHIDLQMNPDQRRLDKACSPNTSLHPASCFTSSSGTEDEGEHESCLAAWVLFPATQGTAGENNKLLLCHLMSENTGNNPVISSEIK